MPNGKNTPLTNENKRQYVQLYTEFRLRTLVKKQIEAVQHGLFEIIPREALAIFDAGELEVRVGKIGMMLYDSVYMIVYVCIWLYMIVYV